jgi:ankyrin repeat protein
MTTKQVSLKTFVTFILGSVLPLCHGFAEDVDHETLCRHISNGEVTVVRAFLDAKSQNLNKKCARSYRGVFNSENAYPLELAFNTSGSQAARTRGLALAELLISRGADINLQKDDGITIFLSVFKEARKDDAFLDFLKFADQHQADFKATIKPAKPDTKRWRDASGPFSDQTGMTPLMLLATSSDFENGYGYALRSRSPNTKTFESTFEFITKRSDILARDAYGRNALHHAVDHTLVRVSNLLVEAGISSKLEDSAGLSSYHYALAVGNKDLLEIATKGLASEAIVQNEHQIGKENSSELNTAQNIQPTPQNIAIEEIAPVPSHSSLPLAQATEFSIPLNDKPDKPVQGNQADKIDSIAARYSKGLEAANRGNFQEALVIWKALANDGHSPSQYQLGRIYARGDGVKRDFTVARKFFENAANNNFADASFSLGIMYLKGDGVSKDKTKAIRYLQEAEKGGNKKAGEILKNLS